MDTENLFNEADAEYNKGNLQRAFSLFLEAAKNGDDSAMGRVACMLGDGEGVEYDFEKSVYWDKKAVDAGNLSSMYNLGVSYRTKGDMKQAKFWFEKSFKSGDSDAAIQLAKILMDSESELENVVYYLRKALQDKDLDEDAKNEAETMLFKIEGKNKGINGTGV